MKPIVNVLFVISLALAQASEGHTAEPNQLRVLCYNVHHCVGVDKSLDLERIADVIRSVRPDVVALQEVDQNVKRSGHIDQPAELGKLTNMHVAFGGNIPLQGGHYGNAILSRCPITRVKNHLLPNLDSGEQRGVMEADISFPQPIGSLLLFATHLDYRSDERERLASATVINNLAAKSSARPALLAGDLNAQPNSNTLKQLDAMWTRTNKAPMATVPVGQPKKQIDFILFRPRNRWKVIETKVLDEAIASDHRAIFAILELKRSRH